MARQLKRVKVGEFGDVEGIWCWRGRHWKAPEEFSIDAQNRLTARQGMCKTCAREYQQTRKQERAGKKNIQRYHFDLPKDLYEHYVQKAKDQGTTVASDIRHILRSVAEGTLEYVPPTHGIMEIAEFEAHMKEFEAMEAQLEALQKG